MAVLFGAGAASILSFIIAGVADNEDLLMIAVPFLIFANVMGFLFHYKVWKVIPNTYSTVTTAKAVWFLFIPVYGFSIAKRSIQQGARAMLKIIIVIFISVSIVACTGTTKDSSKKKLSQHERDSILAETDLPGAGVVGRAIEVSDSSTARAKRLDDQSD